MSSSTLIAASIGLAATLMIIVTAGAFDAVGRGLAAVIVFTIS